MKMNGWIPGSLQIMMAVLKNIPSSNCEYTLRIFSDMHIFNHGIELAVYSKCGSRWRHGTRSKTKQLRRQNYYTHQCTFMFARDQLSFSFVFILTVSPRKYDWYCSIRGEHAPRMSTHHRPRPIITSRPLASTSRSCSMHQGIELLRNFWWEILL